MGLTMASYSNQILAALTASLSFFVAGEVRGWASPSVPNMNITMSISPLGKENASWITSAPPIGAIPAALIASFLLQWIGRRLTLIFATMLYIFSWIILGTGSIHESLIAIIIARAFVGIAVGLIMPAAQIYVSECTSPEIRGILGSLPAIFMAFGISATYFVGAFVSWNVLSYLCAIVPCIGLISTFLVPESPIWLKNKGRSIEAMNSALWLKNEAVLETLKGQGIEISTKTIDTNVSVDVEKSIKKNDITKVEENGNELFSRKTVVPFGISMCLMIFQQWTGVNTVIFNTVTIFKAAKISIDAHLASNIVGFIQLVATAMSIFLVDKAGRRILLIASGLIMSLSLSVIGVYFYVLNGQMIDSIEMDLSWLPLASLIIFMIGYSAGFATLPYVLMGELLPSKYRNTLGGVASSFNLLHTFLVLKLFSTMETALGYHGVFWIYAINSLIGTIFVIFVLPETKGKSLTEIEQLFAGKVTTKQKK